MSLVKIISDSTFDMPLDLINKYDIEVIPANIIINEEIISHYDITNKEFYERLKQGDMPSSGVPAPKIFKNAYENALKKSDEVIIFTLSKKLSAMYQTAVMVNNQFFNGELTIIDTQTTTVEMSLIVLEAAKLANNGATKDEIIYFTKTQLIPYSHLLGAIASLKYLRKGGRISGISWLLGSIFHQY